MDTKAFDEPRSTAAVVELAVVVPTFNERDYVSLLLERLVSTGTGKFRATNTPKAYGGLAKPRPVPYKKRLAPAQRIALQPTDAMNFTANAVSFDRYLVLSGCTDELRRKLEARGMAVIKTPLHASAQWRCGLLSNGAA
jgi:hypothetical protein